MQTMRICNILAVLIASLCTNGSALLSLLFLLAISVSCVFVGELLACLQLYCSKTFWEVLFCRHYAS